MTLEETSKAIEQIQERNARVEADKAWELSWVRRLSIAFSTYIIATAWLYLINDSMPLLKSLVPVAGYILSTLSLPVIKRWWINKRK